MRRMIFQLARRPKGARTDGACTETGGLLAGTNGDARPAKLALTAPKGAASCGSLPFYPVAEATQMHSLREPGKPRKKRCSSRARFYMYAHFVPIRAALKSKQEPP